MTGVYDYISLEQRITAAERSCDELEALIRVLGTSVDTPMHRSEIKQRTKKLNSVLNSIRSDMINDNSDSESDLGEQALLIMLDKVTNKLLLLARRGKKKMKEGKSAETKEDNTSKQDETSTNQYEKALLSAPQGGKQTNPFYETIANRSDQQEVRRNTNPFRNNTSDRSNQQDVLLIDMDKNSQMEQEYATMEEIANDTVEVSEAFQILADLVNEQEEKIDTIEESAIDTRILVGQSTAELERAKIYQRKRRKRLFCMFLLTVAIISLLTFIISSFAND